MCLRIRLMIVLLSVSALSSSVSSSGDSVVYLSVDLYDVFSFVLLCLLFLLIRILLLLLFLLVRRLPLFLIVNYLRPLLLRTRLLLYASS